MRWLLMLWLIAIVLLATGPALAGDIERARSLESEANKALKDGEHARAARAFAEAYAIVPRAATKYNEAYSWQSGGELSRAADAYAQALSLSELPAELRAASRLRLEQLRRDLGLIRLDCPKAGTVSVGHVKGAPIPAETHVVPGRHKLQLQRPQGAPIERELTLSAGQVLQLEIGCDTPAEEGPNEPRKAADTLGETTLSTQLIVGWTGIGLGSAAGIGAVLLGALGLDANDTFKDGGRIDPEQRATAVGLLTASTVVGIAALAVGGTGLVLVLTDDSDSGEPGPGEPSAGEVSLTLSGTSISAAVRW